MQVKIVDAAVKYECLYTGQEYALIIRNALHVPSMANNLIPLFMLREVEIKVKDTPKIHCDDPTVRDHAIEFPETGFKILLLLWGVFSYFPTSNPTEEFLQEAEEVYMLTPNQWNPHNEAFAHNEASMIDWEGNMVEPRDRQQILLSEVPVDDWYEASSVQVSNAENERIDQKFGQLTLNERVDAVYDGSPRGCNEIASLLVAISPTLHDQTLYERMSSRAELGDIQIAAGSTNLFRGDFLHDNKDDQQNESNLDDVTMEVDQDTEFDQLYEQSLRREVNLDKIVASAMYANKSRGVDAPHLAKIWRLDHEVAKKTSAITSQYSKHTDNPKLSQNYRTGDRMLCYNESTTTSSWTPFSPPRKEASHCVATPVANCLSPTRASCMSCPCATSLKSYKQSSCLERKLELLMQSFRICLENRHPKISESFVRRLAPCSSSLRKGLRGPTKPNSILD